jgi:hypothetical protein
MEGNNKMYLEKQCLRGSELIHLAHNRDHFLDLVNTVMHLPAKNVRN